jgi:hypothetical protein
MGSVRPTGGATLPTPVAGPAEATGDVLGLGHEQIVRLRGSRVEVVAPEVRGGHLLSIFEAGTDITWPGCDRPFIGQDVLSAVGHPASQVAVIGRRIAVSRIIRPDGPWSEPANSRPGCSVVELFEADGTLVTRRTFPDGVAVTALDGVTAGDTDYLAIGLGTTGTRIALAGQPGLPDHHIVPADWRRRVAGRDDREIVLTLRFGTTSEGRTVLASGAITSDGTAVAVTDLVSGRLLWSDIHQADQPLRELPTSIELGRFGSKGTPSLSVAWSSGRLTVHDAERGTRPFSSDGGRGNAVVAQRFVTATDGRCLLAARRQVDSVVLSAAPRGELLALRTGLPDDLPSLIEDLVRPRSHRRLARSSVAVRADQLVPNRA